MKKLSEIKLQDATILEAREMKLIYGASVKPSDESKCSNFCNSNSDCSGGYCPNCLKLTNWPGYTCEH